ncbi:MAG: NAD(P)H-binding protein, partial [Anaerolineales bacterium]
MQKEQPGWRRRLQIPNRPSEWILVTGASGYIASQLVPRLLEKGYRIRCLVRNPDHLKYRSWISQVEVSCGDLTEPESYKSAMIGI